MAKLMLKSSSLIEVIVAMVLISIISSISIMIYLNTLSSLSNAQQQTLNTKARFYVNQVAQEPELKAKEFIDEEGYKVIVVVEDHEYIEELFVLTGTVTDSLEVQSASYQRLKYWVE